MSCRDRGCWHVAHVHLLLAAGYRVVTDDRPGFGRSSRPTTGHDVDPLADDLEGLLTWLDLYDVTRGTGRLMSCVFIESLAPPFVKPDDNPQGVDEAAGRSAWDVRDPCR